MDFSKLQKIDPEQAEPAGDELIEAIVKVKVADYVPKDIVVRARIDALVFTAVATGAQIDALGEDPNVQSVQQSEPVSFTEPRAESLPAQPDSED